MTIRDRPTPRLLRLIVIVTGGLAWWIFLVELFGWENTGPVCVGGAFFMTAWTILLDRLWSPWM